MNRRSDGVSCVLTAALDDPPPGDALVVGFSGGVDSTALLHALIHALPRRPIRAIHVCHHLQPEAEAWAAYCERRCRAWQVAFTRADVRVVDDGEGAEAAARDARYAAVAAALTPGEIFVTAHHADDQAETFLLQALRGAGPEGLAGMPRRRTLGPGVHWRPWLTIERAQIERYACAQSLHWIEDPSNADPRVARSVLRQAVMPALREHWPAFTQTLARSASHAGEAAAAVRALAERDLAAVRDTANRLDIDRLAGYPSARAKQVVRRWLAESGFDTPDHRHVDAVLALPDARLTASPCVGFAATEVRRFQRRLYAMRRLDAVPTNWITGWPAGDVLTLPAGAGVLAAVPSPDRDLALTVCFRRGGERLVDARGRRRRLKEWLRVARVPPWVRERLPLVYHDGELVAIGDLWRHPQLEERLGMPIRFVWRDTPFADTLRVVDA